MQLWLEDQEGHGTHVYAYCGRRTNHRAQSQCWGSSRDHAAVILVPFPPAWALRAWLGMAAGAHGCQWCVHGVSCKRWQRGEKVLWALLTPWPPAGPLLTNPPTFHYRQFKLLNVPAQILFQAQYCREGALTLGQWRVFNRAFQVKVFHHRSNSNDLLWHHSFSVGETEVKIKSIIPVCFVLLLSFFFFLFSLSATLISPFPSTRASLWVQPENWQPCSAGAVLILYSNTTGFYLH